MTEREDAGRGRTRGSGRQLSDTRHEAAEPNDLTRSPAMRRIALLDRDGTINVRPTATRWVLEPDGIALLPGAAEAVRRLNEAQIPAAVVTNQRGIAMGAMTTDDLTAVHERVAELLDEHGAHIDLWLHCPHDNDSCACRKPLPGLLLQALGELDGDPAQSAMFGDADTDMQAAQAAGVAGMRVTAERSLRDAVDEWLAAAT